MHEWGQWRVRQISVLGVILPPYEDMIAGCLSSESDHWEGLKLGLFDFKGEDKTNKQTKKSILPVPGKCFSGGSSVGREKKRNMTPLADWGKVHILVDSTPEMNWTKE